jgi:hypothetical protein
MRQIFPLELTPSNRPPTDMQLVESVRPFLIMAMFDVPPPISQDKMVLWRFLERAAAPEPIAAIMLSKLGPAVAATNFPASLGPAVAATNFPASLESALAICLAFFLRADSPVTITAPVWISVGSIPARLYSDLRKSVNLLISIVLSSSRGVWMIRPSYTMFLS